MNPELRRNLWLEITRQRLVLTPILLVLLLALISADERRPWPHIHSVAVGLFVLLVHFWGMRKATESIAEEVRDRTWDGQRLSSLTPWEMSLGKLFGATAFTWYAGGLCLVVMAAAALLDRGTGSSPYTMAMLVASAVALHGAALAGSLQASRKDSRMGSRIGVLMLIPVALVTASLAFSRRTGLASVTWYGTSYDGLPFATASLSVFAAWAVLAVQREMSRELKVPVLPWAYPAFALFVAAYVAGFPEPVLASRATSFVFAGLFASLFLTYYGIVAETTNAVSLRRIASRVRSGDWRRAAEGLPLWGSALGVAGAFALAAVFVPQPGLPFRTPQWVGLFPIALWLLAVRDAGLLVFFALSPRSRRPEGAALLAIAMFSWLVPGLFAAMGAPSVASALLPFGLPGWQATSIAAVHVALVAALVAWRWRAVAQAVEHPGNAAAPGV